MMTLEAQEAGEGEGYRTYYDMSGSQIKDCPVVTCDEGVPGLACSKVRYTLTKTTLSQWEYRNCSSMFHSECKDVMKLDKDICAITLRCTTDGCNGYTGDTTVIPPPAKPFPTSSPGDAGEEALGMPIILGAAAGGIIILIIIIIVVVVLVRMGRRKRGDGYEKADEGEGEKTGDNFKMYKDACQDGQEKSTRKSIKNFYKKSNKAVKV